MTMDNGAEVLAKIPNPNVGSTFYTTASEVATQNFVSILFTSEFNSSPDVYPVGPRGFELSRTAYTCILLGST